MRPRPRCRPASDTAPWAPRDSGEDRGIARFARAGTSSCAGRLTRGVLLFFPRQRSSGGRRALRRDDGGKVGGPGPHHGHEPFPFEPAELRFEIVEVHAAENLEELVLLQAQGPPLLQDREDSLPQSAFDGAGLFQPEGPVDDLNREGVERVLDELTRPSRRVDVRRPERFREGPDILLRNGASFCQVPLVHDEKYRHVPHNLECRRNPVVQGVQAVLARQVADAHQGLGTVVVRLSHEVPESPLAHDIKNRHADLDLDVRAVGDGELYLLRIEISTNDDGFIHLGSNGGCMRFRREGPRIPVPTWLIEWSKSRDLFLSLAHDAWVLRPN